MITKQEALLFAVVGGILYIGIMHPFDKVVKNTTLEQVKDDKKTHTVVTRVKSPSGEIKTTVVTDKIETRNTEIARVVSTTSSKTMSVSILAIYDKQRYPSISYGISVSKQVVGPVTVGLFGFDNGTLGASVGINF